MRRAWHFTLIVCSLSNIAPSWEAGARWMPCVELKRNLHVPCECSMSTEYSHHSIEMNCDRAVFTRDTVESMRGQPIVSVSQRDSGYQSLPEDLLDSGLSLRKLDLSGNSIHRLMGRLLAAQDQLEELRLADNLLGDSLNPIFSSNEFHGMKRLRLLDLSRNGLRGIEEGILKGCENLELLYLDGNNLTVVPTSSLKGPRSIRVVSLSGNNIGSLPRAAFSTIGESLLRLDLSENELSRMEDGALSGLDRLLLLNLSRNDLVRFNSDVFKGAYNLLQLDLSSNLLREFPTDALRHLTDLKFLNISDNLIDGIEQTHLSTLRELQVLDLSRNDIGRLGANAFSELSELTRLDLSLNALRTIEESSFDGLTKLKWLSLRDNNILLVPTTALIRLPSLTDLRMEFNRIAALPIESIGAIAPNLATMALARNLIREIPAGLFQEFDGLVRLELSGNTLTRLSRDSFLGLEETLLELDVSSNRLTAIGELPLKRLISLNLAGNRLTRIPPETFEHLANVRYLNLSSNPLFGGFPPVFPSSVIDLDVSRTNLNVLPAILLRNLVSLERISLADNRLERIEEGTFDRPENLSRINLSGNLVDSIANAAFVGLTSLYELNLRGNRLKSFAGEHFDTGTGLEILDLSSNRIDRVSPTAFAVHPRLRVLDLSYNRFLYFPGDYVKPLQFLERLDLSGNGLKRVAEFAFSQLGRLRALNLARNRIESVDELAFHNSTQLRSIDLSENIVEALSERAMEGLLRLELLDLRENRLTSLPETIFDPSRVRSVERIDLSGNLLNEIPSRSLQRQTAASPLFGLNLARNRITELTSTSQEQLTSNVKELDLSGNPLSGNAINAILGEAKILRTLNLADTGAKIERLTIRLETPFLKKLNLSGNNLLELDPRIFERTTMLETLDVSRNRLSDFQSANRAFRALPALRWLDVSGNDAKIINETSFDGLTGLRTLKMSDLRNCTRIERNAFKGFTKLRSLSAYDYPRLGYFDVQGVLKGMSSLELVDIEIKDSSVSNEQLSLRAHPRLNRLTLRGERLRSIASSSLVGVRGPKLSLGLTNTSVDSIPAALFFPVPRSTYFELDLSGSKLTALSSQFLAALDERRGFVAVSGLRYNPIDCTCDARQLQKWLKAATTVAPIDPSNLPVCSTPPRLAGSELIDLPEQRLLCDDAGSSIQEEIVIPDDAGDARTAPSTGPPPLSSSPFSSSSVGSSSFSEPEIIWTVAPAVQNGADRNRNLNGINNGDRGDRGPSSISSGTDDTLIIGIVAGVVAFIALIVIIICVCRFRCSSGPIDQAHLAAAVAAASSIPDVSMVRPASAYSGKINLGSYNGGSTLDRGNPIASPLPTMPLQMMPFVQTPQGLPFVHTLALTPQAQSHLQAQQFYGYCDGSSLPVYIPTCSTDNAKCYDR